MRRRWPHFRLRCLGVVLGVDCRQLGFQPGAFTISATGTYRVSVINHGHTVSQAQSVLKYWYNRTICNGMCTEIVVASVCRFESLMGTIGGSVVVQRDRVGMYMAIHRVMHSLRGR